MRNCPSCNTLSKERLIKENIKYYQCEYCGTLFSGALPNDNMVGGGFEIERNTQQNEGRLQRFRGLLSDKEIKNCNILDFGCGNGMLVDYVKSFDINIVGYDKYNEKFNTVKELEFDLVSMIEVIEHCSHPFEEINLINLLLKDGGILYIETSFVNIAYEEKIPLEDFFYINPKVGHSTIFSHYGLDLLMIKKGFLPLNHINRNVRLYKKATSN